MQVVVPMAGFGRRFQAVGYSVPKPLIDVHGRPMVQHVVELFPGAEEVLFLVNEDHLAVPEWRMQETLQRIRPDATIASVPSHRLGPVHTVVAGAEHIDLDDEIIVVMCDLNHPWDFEHFRRWVSRSRSDGCVVSYRGFHPHFLHSTHYAFLRSEGAWATEIREKHNFTDDVIRNREWCSNGVYWFRTGALALEYLRRVHGDPSQEIAGEHYVSQVYQPMIEDGLKVSIYEIQHYLQWGHPRDLAEYLFHSEGFASRVRRPQVGPSIDGTLLIPMAGLGSRFAAGGISTPKPLVEVAGQPMAVAAARDLPAMSRQVFVLRQDMPGLSTVVAELEQAFVGCRCVLLDRATDGQARTVWFGLELGGIDLEAPVVVGTCDSGVHHDPQAHAEALGGADVLVWGFRGHPAAGLHPEQYGWIAQEGGEVTGVSVKVPLSDPATDPIVLGIFSFARAEDLQRCLERLFARDARVNGELYLDSVIDDALALGLRVRMFAVDHFEGWGTPDELSVFRYWQSHFHKWKEHPYLLQEDPRVPPESVEGLAEEFAAWKPEWLEPR